MELPKRLIEVDLPIKRISAHARREKSIRHGHISTLHIWWARRPLAACRAVICAALWPDPAHPLCPQAFRHAAEREMRAFAKAASAGAPTAKELSGICDNESWKRYGELAQRSTPMDLKTVPEAQPNGNRPNGASPPGRKPRQVTDLERLRGLLLDFIADFANWDASTVPAFLKTARALTQAAHEALGGAPGTRPLVVDPFAGGGAIPLEALRVGADAFASDLNPVAVLLNKVVLEYIPKYGKRLADEVRKWGQWVKEQAEKELGEFYPKDPDGATPIAYLWARTIKCEGPGCGAEIPLMRSLWLAKKGKNNSVALRIVPHPKAKRVNFDLVEKAKAADVGDGTVARGSATCPCCGFTTPVSSVRAQFRARKGGSDDARLIAIRKDDDSGGRSYRLPTDRDLRATDQAAVELYRRKKAHKGELSLVPEEPLPPQGTLGFRVQLYGMQQWSDLFTSRQLLALTTLVRLVRQAGERMVKETDAGLAEAVQGCLSCALDRLADFNTSLCILNIVGGRGVVHTFGRQALPMVWDFMETNPFNSVGANWIAGVEAFEATIKVEKEQDVPGHAEQASATVHPLPNDAASAFVTDPPYYDAVPYADLSDFFYVWLKRTLPKSLLASFTDQLVPKGDECIVDEVKGKDKRYFEKTMGQAMAEGRRVLAPSGIGLVVFAHKSTAGWEAQLQAMVDAGWTMTGSWPIDTERPGRLRAQDSAALASSVHIVCRPRENADGSLRGGDVGDWRDVLTELPRRIHEWLPRLAEEGVVGADAIFACLGPALEVFSRYSRVEKASGEQVSLRDYLEQVWAAVSKEALGMIFAGGDATGFEEDARLTAMWLWTLASPGGQETAGGDEESEDEGDESGSAGGKKATVAYALEYDAARKIAQGLGAHLEKLAGMVEVKGDTARLLSVSERTKALFGKDQADAPKGKRKKKDNQLKLGFAAELEAAEAESGGWGEKSVSKVGETVLDRLHQSMILFAAGRGEALRRFLVDEGIGRDQRFWRLAQALSALYPAGTDEKRWVDGVLARKKGLGF